MQNNERTGWRTKLGACGVILDSWPCTCNTFIDKIYYTILPITFILWGYYAGSGRLSWSHISRNIHIILWNKLVFISELACKHNYVYADLHPVDTRLSRTMGDILAWYPVINCVWVWLSTSLEKRYRLRYHTPFLLWDNGASMLLEESETATRLYHKDWLSQNREYDIDSSLLE